MGTDTTPTTVGDLFERPPTQFGFRGDPWLWAALRERLAQTPLPADVSTLRQLVRDAVQDETGASIDDRARDSVFVERFAHGGMSSGHVSLPWWRETGIQVVADRWAAVTRGR